MYSMTPQELRSQIRAGSFSSPTTGLALGYVQANLMVIPREFAFDFLLFCQRNPKPCPIVEVLESGYEPACARGADLRTDLPRYRIYRNGSLDEERQEVYNLWRDDLVTFLIGCSFSFEAALQKAGIAMRHIDQGRNVSMYRTNIFCQSAGRLQGNMVVSMRPISSHQIAQAVEISSKYTHVHGSPIHIGHPEKIGITDLKRTDFGDTVDIYEDEIPVFWACGVTPQVVALESRIPFCITHSPGKMFITDLPCE